MTGAYYEQGQVTGPFGMAPGKVTGTEEARFGRSAPTAPTAVPADAALIDGRVKTRITGEGIDAGHKITGDDWDRGDRVTGTEERIGNAPEPDAAWQHQCVHGHPPC